MNGKRSVGWVVTLAVICVVLFFGPAVARAEDPKVVCVPGSGQNVSVPHNTWDGKQITLKGTVRSVAVGTTFTYEWDFDDGSAVVSGIGTNPYVIETSHTYYGSVGKLFAAKLTVTYDGKTASDYYLVEVKDGNDLAVKVNVAIDESLWRLHKDMVRGTYTDGVIYGYWARPGTTSYRAGYTGACTEAFEIQGHLPEGNVNEDPYVETVQRGLNYLLNTIVNHTISNQNAGDPDTNGNDYGLKVNSSSTRIYESGIVLMAFASSRAPERVAQAGIATYVKNRKYKEIAQDMIDFLAYAQNEAGSGRGGWRYYENYSSSDNSIAQWPVIGIEAAETNFGGAGLTTPGFVRTELEHWVTYIQNANGGSGYYLVNSWVNVAKTGSLLCEFAFLGDNPDTDRVKNAAAYMGANWGNPAVKNRETIGCYYAMYSVMKGLRLLGIERLPDGSGGDFDWYADQTKGLATRLVASQNSNGSWSANNWWVVHPLSTAWSILILQETVVDPGPVADAGPDKPGSPPVVELEFDASGSYHLDPNKTIIEYSWDFDDSDGVDWNNPDLTSTEPIVNHVFPAAYNSDGSIDWSATEGEYTVTLRVKDNSMPDPKFSIDTCVVQIVAPPWEPIADAGGPYEELKNNIVTLDGSGSCDPNGEVLDPAHPWYSQIVSWEWDLDNDGQYDNAAGETVQHTWSAEGIYIVSLLVTNTHGATDTDDVVVTIGNRAPIADAGGPYSCGAGAITFDGSGSSDPDGDALEYRWDFESDGVYDTGWSSDPTATYTYSVSGNYLASLQVRDTDGATDIDTADVVPHQPPVADAGPDHELEQTSADGASVTLDGSGSTDPDGDELTYLWKEADTILAGPSTDPLAGVTLPLGAHTITLTVDDGNGGADSCDVSVTVSDTTAPTVVAQDVSVEQATAAGTELTLTAQVSDVCDVSPVVTWSQGPTAIFPLGTTSVTVTATDASGNSASKEIVVSVVDTTPPNIVAPGDITAEQTSADGAWFDPGVPLFWDICDADPLLTNDISGVFPLGVTIITWTVTDASGNTATATQTITVIDTTPPTVTAPPDITTEQTSANGTPVSLGTPVVSDICDASPAVANNAPAVFPLGETTVTWTVTDASGNTTTVLQIVTVVDTTAPSITAPPDVSFPEGAIVDLGTPDVSDICDASPTVTNDAPAEFPLGETVVTWTATDASGNTSTATQTVTVEELDEFMEENLGEELGDAIDEILADPDIPDEAADEIQEALDDIIGNNGGQANNGASDKLADGNLIAALNMMKKSVEDLQDAADDGYDTTDLQAQVTEFARLAVLVAIQEAAELLGEDDPSVVAATGYMNEGNVLLEAGDFLGAIAKYKKAAQELD